MVLGQPGGGGSRDPASIFSYTYHKQKDHCDVYVIIVALWSGKYLATSSIKVCAWIITNLISCTCCACLIVGHKEVWRSTKGPYFIEDYSKAPDITGSGVLLVVQSTSLEFSHHERCSNQCPVELETCQNLQS